MAKKIVHYDEFETDFSNITIGRHAYIKPLDHPDLSNRKMAITTTVLSINKDERSFETLNTIYKPR